VNAWDWIAGALLVAGVGVQVLACIGLAVGRGPFDRLHLMAPATMLGGPLVCAAILVNESFSQGGIKAVIVAVILLVTGPVLSHATARAARLRATGHVPVLPSEARSARQS
jgi:multicomponent Na+:H+ antiporter subunit G